MFYEYIFFLINLVNLFQLHQQLDIILCKLFGKELLERIDGASRNERVQLVVGVKLTTVRHAQTSRINANRNLFSFSCLFSLLMIRFDLDNLSQTKIAATWNSNRSSRTKSSFLKKKVKTYQQCLFLFSPEMTLHPIIIGFLVLKM